MFQELTLVGTLGRDPELRYTQSGKEVVSFSLAVRDYDKSTIWFNCQAWEKTGEAVKSYAQKGMKLLVVGRLRHDEKGNPRMFDWNGQQTARFDVNVDKVLLLGGGGSKAPQETEQEDDIAF